MITILLCSYNGAPYIEAQLRSIMDQSEQGFRVLVSDDGSSDGTPKLVQELAEGHPGKIALLRQPVPSGGACRHFLSLLTSGSWKMEFWQGASEEQACQEMKKNQGMEPDYLMFSDQDDVWHPDKIEKTLRRMKALEAVYQKETPLLVHCDSVVVDADMRMIAPSYTAYQQMTQSRNQFHQLLVQNNVTGGAMMINRSLAELIHSMPAHAVMHDQWIALVAAAFGEIRYLEEALYDYRQHGSNVLGAEKGNPVKEVLGRLGIGRRDGRSKKEMDVVSRSVYQGLFQQAESFQEIYGGQLKPRQKKQLAAFIRMQHQNRGGKIWCILRHGFTYNRLHRTVGECIFI